MNLRHVVYATVAPIVVAFSGIAHATSYPEDVESVASVVRRSIARIQRCYDRSLKRNPKLEGSLTVALAIGPDGRVREAHIAKTTLEDVEAPLCMVDVLRTLHYGVDPSGEERSVLLPFQFRAR